MQVDQFESEVESLSVQTRKKKGDKDVSGGPGVQRAGGGGGGPGAQRAGGRGRGVLAGGQVAGVQGRVRPLGALWRPGEQRATRRGSLGEGAELGLGGG